MSDGISQADLDALFSGLGDAATEPKKEPKQEEGGGLNQSDLDALFSGLDMGAPSPPAEEKKSVAVKMEEAWEAAPPVDESKGESLSQDDIDKMLAEFGLG
jgi:hypothetical protein